MEEDGSPRMLFPPTHIRITSPGDLFPAPGSATSIRVCSPEPFENDTFDSPPCTPPAAASAAGVDEAVIATPLRPTSMNRSSRSVGLFGDVSAAASSLSSSSSSSSAAASSASAASASASAAAFAALGAVAAPSGSLALPCDGRLRLRNAPGELLDVRMEREGERERDG